MAWAFSRTALLTLPLMAAVQEIADRTALATDPGLATWPCGVPPVRPGSPCCAPGCRIVANGLSIAADLVAIGSGMQFPATPGRNGCGRWWQAPLITTLLVLGPYARNALGLQVLGAALLSSCGPAVPRGARETPPTSPAPGGSSVH